VFITAAKGAEEGAGDDGGAKAVAVADGFRAESLSAAAMSGRRLGRGADFKTTFGSRRGGAYAGPARAMLAPASSSIRANASNGVSARAAVTPNTIITIREKTLGTPHLSEISIAQRERRPRMAKHRHLNQSGRNVTFVGLDL
jgi:hypothetical protein